MSLRPWIWESGRDSRRRARWTRRPSLERVEERTLLSAGSLDLTFGTGGRVLTNLGSSGGSSDVVGALTLRNGQVLVGGQANGLFAIARYNANGTLDTAFGNGGKVVTDLGGDDAVSALAIQNDGRIVVGAYSSKAGGHSPRSSSATARTGRSTAPSPPAAS